MSIVNAINLDHITLEHGSHPSIQAGGCAMEWVAFMAGEPHSDSPQCASPVISAFVRNWNDNLNDADRNRLLKPILPRVIGSRASHATENARAWMAADWTVREYAPAWLDLAGLTERASALRALVPLTDTASALAASPTIEAAREAGRAAGDAAWDAAGAAAWDAAGDAAWDAAGAAAGDAAGAAAGDAARAAAWAAAWAAAGAAAWAAAGAAAGDAAWDAARDRLAPVVTTLQESALALVGRMLDLRDEVLA